MEKFTNKECKTHGATEFVLEGRGYYRCKKCRSERVTKQRKKNKERLVAAHGGGCTICGYNKSNRALHFHHVDPTSKEFGLSFSGKSISIDRMKKEAEKCILLCSNCHAEIEDGVTSIPEWPTGKATRC